MDLQWLITFKMIAERGSYAKAATELGYAPSTLVNQIRQLERELSTKLFVKNGQKVQLSPAGENIIPMVDQMILLPSS